MKLATFNRKMATHPGAAAMRARLSAADPVTARLNTLNDQVFPDAVYGTAVKQTRHQATYQTDAGLVGLGWFDTRAGAVAACEAHAG